MAGAAAKVRTNYDELRLIRDHTEKPINDLPTPVKPDYYIFT